MVDYSPEKKSIRDYYKEFMGRGDEVGRDQRNRRNKRIRTQKEAKRIKEQTQDLKKDIKSLKRDKSRLRDPSGKKLYGEFINTRKKQILKNRLKTAVNLGAGAAKKVGPLGFISTLLSPTPAYKKGGVVNKGSRVR
jgi:hypothetical protein